MDGQTDRGSCRERPGGRCKASQGKRNVHANPFCSEIAQAIYLLLNYFSILRALLLVECLVCGSVGFIKEANAPFSGWLGTYNDTSPPLLPQLGNLAKDSNEQWKGVRFRDD